MRKLTDDYTIASTLFENAVTIIYRAARKSDGRSVILKTHKRPEDTYKIKHEYDMLHGKQIEGISNVLDIFNNNVDPLYLVSEDLGGIVLEEYLQSGTPVGQGLFITFCLHAARALESVHAKGIIHRDIKPANMLIDPNSMLVFYIDFGISVLTKRGQGVTQDSIAGTLEYMAPEQTGRISNIVDFRSDLYALGVVMYRVVSGKLPFVGKTAMELIHAHIAMRPEPLAHIEPIVSRGILKLLEKRPDDRYQTAGALVYDVERCKALYDSGQDCNKFMLAEKDIFYALEPGRKLYGKEEALKSAAYLLESMDDHHVELVLLSGPAGAGKTAILNELERRALKKSSLLFRADYEQGEKKEPYYALRKAFASFEALVYDAKMSLSFYLEEFQKRLGSNARVLLQIFPAFENLVGQYPTLPALPPAENQARVEQVFRVFMRILCSIPCPCVFFFDNVQWADEASLRLLFAALDDTQLGNCVMFFSFRDENSKTSARLHHYIGAMRTHHANITTIQALPLNVKSIKKIVMDVFPQSEESALDLAQLAFMHSRGDIRRVKVYFKDLFHTGAVYFDEQADIWRWRREGLEHMGEQDVGARIKGIYNALPADTKYVVSVLSALGLSVSKEQIDIAFGPQMSREEVEQALGAVVEQGYFVIGPSQYAFDSTRVRKIAYKMIPEEERPALHSMLLGRLYAAYKDDMDAMIAHCSMLTEQYYRSNPDPHDMLARRRFASLNRLAGDAARDANYIEHALQFYETAISLLGDSPLSVAYEEAFPALLHYASCKFAEGELEVAADIYQQVKAAASSEQHYYEVCAQEIRQHFFIADWMGVEALARAYLKDTGLLLDELGDKPAQMQEESKLYTSNARKLGEAYFLEAPFSKEPSVERNGSMLAALVEATLLNMHYEDNQFYIHRAMNYGYRHGIYTGIEKVFSLLADRCANAGKPGKAKKVFEMGLACSKKHGLEQSVLYASYCASIVHLVEPLANIPEVYQRTKHIALMEGALHYSAFADLMLLSYNIFTGANMAFLQRETNAAIFNAEKSHFRRFSVLFRATFRQFARCMSGKTSSPASFEDHHFSEKAYRKSVHPISWAFNSQYYYIYRLQALFTNGYYREAVAVVKELQALLPDQVATSSLARVSYYFYYSLSLIRLCEEEPALMKTYLPIIRRNQQQLQSFAKVQQENFSIKHALVEVELQRLSTSDIPLRHLSEIHDACVLKNYIWDIAIIEESLAGAWAKKGIAQYHDMHIANARALYDKLGARVKALQLVGGEIETDNEQAPSLSTDTLFGPTDRSAATDSAQSVLLDHQAILQVISSLASEQSLDAMLEQFLLLLLENGGAEHALVFLLREEQVFLTALRYSQGHPQGFLFQALPLRLDDISEDMVPHKLIMLTLAKKLRLVANSEDNEFAFLGDSYLSSNKPASFLCAPILSRGVLLGCVYLEHAKLPGVFPPARLHFLEHIILQASVLIQNGLAFFNLEDYTADLEKRLASYIGQLNMLIAGIAHEINSPLGVCVTVGSRLEERNSEIQASLHAQKLSKNALVEYLEEAGSGFAILNGNLNRAGGLVANFKQISVDQSTGLFDEYPLLAVLRDIVEYTRPAVKHSIGAVQVNGPESLVFYTSTGVLAQIFTNLIMNSAIHAFERARREENKIAIDVTDSEGFVTIVYSDNGRGMTNEEREQVFMPFFTTKRKEGGSGLGGHIVLTLVTQTLFGTVHCTSTLGQGTSFTLKLPKMTQAERKERSHA